MDGLIDDQVIATPVELAQVMEHLPDLYGSAFAEACEGTSKSSDILLSCGKKAWSWMSWTY